MPNRIVREGINSSERVDQLSEGAEVFYRRLINVVDDFGMYEATPVLLLARCYPRRVLSMTEQQITGYINECVKSELVEVYDGFALILDEKKKLIQTGKPKKIIKILDFNQQTRSNPKFTSNAKQLRSNRVANAHLDVSVVVVGVEDVLAKKTTEAQTTEPGSNGLFNNEAEKRPPEKKPKVKTAVSVNSINVGAHFMELFRRHRGGEYKIMGRDWNAVKQINKSYGPGDAPFIRKLIEAYFYDNDRNLHNLGHPLWMFVDRINKYAAMAKAPIQAAEEKPKGMEKHNGKAESLDEIFATGTGSAERFGDGGKDPERDVSVAGVG